jgi:secreted PhoX family phosphatase
MKRIVVFAAATALIAAVAGADAGDFGQQVEQLLNAKSNSLFGLNGTLDASSTTQVTGAEAEADPTKLVTLARGLKAHVVSKDPALGGNVDQIALWPSDTRPTHLIFCNEEGTSAPAIQRVTIATGEVATILTGLNRCDPLRRTAWGTVFAAEENGAASRVVEIIDPLHTTNVTISGTTISGANAANIAVRSALGALSFEGFGAMPNGVIYYGDEKRPGTGGVGGLGGSLYKFIPKTPWVVGNPPITDLAQSPLVDGRVFGFRPGRNGGSFSNTDAGPGNEFGRGWWIEIVEGQVINGVTIHKADLGAAATALHLAAYYRPEDIDVDLAALEQDKVRVCGTNTGQDIPQGDNHFGEVYCLTDGTLEQAADTTTLTQSLSTLGVSGNVPYTTLANSTPEYQPLVIGFFDFAMMDNIAYQPSTGNWILHEDGEGPSSPGALKRGNDLWDCLDDGADRDNLTDGCVKIATINDTIGAGSGGGGAEWTGGIFDATGTHFFVSIQHAIGTGTSRTPGPTYAHGYILDITGWGKTPPGHDRGDAP